VQDVLATLPREVAQASWRMALLQLLATAGFLSGSVMLLHSLPWFLLPIGWAIAGLAASGLFVIGRDAALSAWSPSRLVNRVVEVVTCTPLLTSIQSRRMPTAVLGSLFGAALLYAAGPTGLLKYWLIPLIGFLFWQRTFERVFHAVPLAAAVAGGEVLPSLRCVLPRWLELLGQNINLYIPGDLAALRIPSYRLRAAYAALQENWAPYVSECSLSLTTLRELFTSTPRDASELKDNRDYLRPSPWAGNVHWVHVFIIFGLPLVALYGVWTTALSWKTLAWSFAYYFLTGMGITMGYHRLWSHRAYAAAWPLELALMLLSAGAVQGSCVWWSRNHRAHHRFTDTARDPYNAKEGFWYAHLGWMLVKPNDLNYGEADVRDLKANRIVSFQHRYYPLLVLVMGFVLPTLVAGLGWGDWRGGYFYAAVCRLLFVHHTTFCVNSVAHYFGEHTYDDERTPKDHLVTALMTLGEGYHNFHHEFPNDYRNGIRWYDYDPTKWLIYLCSLVGLAYDLKEFPSNEIRKGQLNMKQKRLDEEKAHLQWGPPIEQLPEMTWEQVRDDVKNKQCALIVIDNVVHDVTEFLPRHPGGEGILRAVVGTDGSKSFHGAVYKHSNAAKNLLSNFRVARLAAPKRD
jgi:stearoyl-CoA desaturase (delta-9 desaturase)